MNPGAITLVGVWAHPDDETYLSATLMHRVARAGGRVVVITATAGEQGVTSAEGESTPTRTEELRRALAAVGVHELVMLGIHDGACAHEDHAQRSRQISTLLDEIDPDAVVTFGPDGITGHRDHIAVSAWTLAACRDRKCDLHLAAMSTSFHTMHRDLHEHIGLSMAHHPLPTVDDHLITARVTPSPDEHVAKMRAFAAHRSQTMPLRTLIGDAAFQSWWIDETFRRPTNDDFDWAQNITTQRVAT
jgi:LmbE family N-acetylglucosaminyl deacetylase